jgi:hypothetical protein
MLAYNRSELHSRYVKEEAEEAFTTFRINEESLVKIIAAYSDNLYTPNYFIRIAIGLLTLVAVVFSAALLFLLMGYVSPGGLITLFIILAIVCYLVLEIFVNAKHYYNAGVDNVLQFCSVLFIILAFYANEFNTDSMTISAVAMLAGALLCLRFADSFMAMLGYASFFVSFFLVYTKFGDIAKSTAPFMMAAVSISVYFLMQKLIRLEKLFYLRKSFNAVKLLSILSLYASLNYYVVRELSSKMFDIEYSPLHPFAYGGIFWFCTILIPFGYVALGIVKRDFYFLRAGLVLIAISIFTVRYYYPVLPAEMAMLIAGVILVVLSYLLMQYLKMPRHGFTFLNIHPAGRRLNIEGLIIAQAFAQQQNAPGSAPHDDMFGGGSGGGGGAGADY